MKKKTIKHLENANIQALENLKAIKGGGDENGGPGSRVGEIIAPPPGIIIIIRPYA